MADATSAALAAMFGSLNKESSRSRGPYDLSEFEDTLDANNLWGVAAAPILRAKFDTSTWSPGETAAVSAGQAFLGAMLNRQSQIDKANQLEAVSNILPAIYENPDSVARPEGVDEQAFHGLQLDLQREKAARDLVRNEKVDKSKEDLFAEVFSKNPAIALSTMPDMAKKFGINIPEIKESKAEELDVEAPATNPLSNDRLSTAEKQKQYFQDFLNQGYPATQAAIAARQQVEGEIKANSKSFDEAKEAREFGQKMLELSNTAKAGIAEAGVTGGFQGPAHAYEVMADFFGSDEAARQLRGDALLSSIEPELVKMSRSPGAVSDYEAKMFLKAGPGTRQTPETNKVLAQKMEDLGKLNLHYADFLEAYREANSGSTVGAGKKWAEYKQAFPIFAQDEKGEVLLNADRPGWQEFFAGVGTPQDIPSSSGGADVPSIGSTFDGKKVTGVKKIK